ncbi:MAG: radical SAM protein [Thermoplasmatota archaeon]
MNLKYGKYDIEGVDINIVHCKSALSRSGLESDYSINPYRGCIHGCSYCYAPFVIREERDWGEFVDVKRNIANVLVKELKKLDKGTVRIGSVTDPYQIVEENYELTRMCLHQLKKKNFPVILQTKSNLVTRDIDIFSEIDIDVGLTITSLDDNFKRMYENNSPSVNDRLKAVEELIENRISTWVFIGPLIPYENDDYESLMELKETLDSLGVKEIYIDKLNMRDGIWKKFEKILDDRRLERLRKIFFGKEDYFEDKKDVFSNFGKVVY